MIQADADAVRAAGWDDQALYHLCAICGLYNMNNRVVDGLGIPGQSKDELAANIGRLTEGGHNTTIAYINAEEVA